MTFTIGRRQLISVWFGVGEYTQKRAQMLGELGFNAFVVDVYGKGIRPNTPSACEAEMMKYATNRPLLRQRARCGLDQLRKVPKTGTRSPLPVLLP